jgi:hypothetical protein
MDVLLLHPPAVKPAEPPLGAAVLLAHLRSRGFSAAALDANLAAYLHLLDPGRLAPAAGPQPATAVRRALHHSAAALDLLRSPAALASFARYSTAVRHLNTALAVWAGDGGRERLTLGDYERSDLSPFAPGDLERLAAGATTSLFTRYFEEELLPQVEAMQPRLIALSVNYRHQVLPAFELAGRLRRRLPQVPVVGGGGIFTSWRTVLRRLDLRFSCFSRIVFGPGEEPLVALAAGGASADDYFQEGAASIGFLPDYSFARLADYLSPVPVLPVSASRGCYWQRCLFCPEAAAPTHPYAALPAASFPELLRELAGRHGARHFHFTDNALPVAVLRQLAAAGPVLPGFSWHGFVRFEQALLDPALVAGLAASGCAMLQLGLESGSQPVLDRLQKGTRLATVVAILDNLKRAGIASYVYVMLGTPGESDADAEQTLRFLETHAEAIGFLNLAIMNLPRESGLLADPAAGIAESELLGAGEPLGLYRSFAPAAGWDRREARRFLDRRLLASPTIRAIVQRTPPLFTSNHAFLFPPPST